MSATTWTAEASASPPISASTLRIFATRVGLGLGLTAVASTAFTGMLLAALMATSIVQF